MGAWFKGYRAVGAVFWLLAGVAVVVWGWSMPFPLGWDLHIYQSAVVWLRAGRDPYAEATAIRQAFHQHMAEHPGAQPPFSYIYSPITLPLLRAIGRVPFWVSGTVYWAAAIAGLVTMLWVGMQFVEERERKVFTLLAPAAIFFPGLVQNDSLFSGNVAYILYGLVLAAAMLGWRKGQWGMFYAVVLGASCFKAPWLTLLAIPVFSARKQWFAAAATGVVGCALFAVQPMIWPALFHHYLEAVELQFAYNRDFSASPAGVLAEALYNVAPYTVTSAVFYAVYAAVIAGVLFGLSRRYLEGRLTLQQWAPLLLVGTVLLNPRVMEYDTMPIVIPMALVAWRFFGRWWMVALFAGINVADAVLGATPPAWKHVECFVLVGVFGVGAWDLWRASNVSGLQPLSSPGQQP